MLSRPAARAMKGGVDIIRAAFERRDRDAALRESAQQAERDGRLAAARARRADDEAGQLIRPPASGSGDHSPAS